MAKSKYLGSVFLASAWLRERYHHRGLVVLCTACSLVLGNASSLLAQPSTVPQEYQRYFVHYQDNRTVLEKALNVVGLSDLEVGRSFALIAGVDTYPNLPAKDRFLKPAQVDLEKLIGYLHDYEFFDEIIVLRNDAVTDANFKYFLQAYFPARLRSFPKSRFLFAYSGHGIQEGARGYLLQSAAGSFADLQNSISLEALTALYRPVTEAAYYSLAMINACHSGSFGAAAFGPEAERRLLPKDPGSHVITAGATQQLAWHLGRVGEGSLFFEEVLAGLGGRADDQPIQRNGDRGDGVITATELFDYLSQEIQLETEQRQQPQLVFFARDKLGSFFFLNRQRQVRANRVPAWEGWHTSFGFDEGKPTASGLELIRLAAAAFGRGDYTQSTELYTQGCDQGDLRACVELGRAYLGGIGEAPIDFTKAVGLFRRACAAGELYGCASLGVAHQYGLGGLARDEPQAVSLYRNSCDGGDMRGCAFLGAAYDYGLGGLAKDVPQAVSLYRKSCDGGDMRGCAFLGAAYDYGLGGLAKDVPQAVSLYRKSCDGGDMRGCSNLGVAYEVSKGGLGKDERKAVSFYRKACGGGEMGACNRLGLAYLNGEGGLTKDDYQAVNLHRKACDGGEMRGCTGLGFAYFNGLGGLTKDERQAALLYQRACDAGEMVSCASLGLVYSTGLGGLGKDERQAASFYQKACDGGEMSSCNNLGSAYSTGLAGLGKDEHQAVSLYQKACDGGEMRGCTNLGFAYYSGLGGLDKDDQRAVDLFQKACDGGEMFGCKSLAIAYEYGMDDLKRNKAQAYNLYHKACNLGNAPSCQELETSQSKK